MTKKRGESEANVSGEWDPDSKEPWLLEFEKEPVNDKKWSCLVTSAIPDKIEDDDCIQIYKQSTGLRPERNIKLLSMSDVISLVRESGTPILSKKGDKKTRGEKVEKGQKKEETPRSPRLTQILNLAVKFATFNDFECRLPSNLMAVLLKHAILKMKEDSVREMKINAVKNRKIRERNLTARFIRDQKPFDANAPKIPKECGSKNDAPANGPDLYILLTDFYDVYIYPELIRINVPFVAFLKISCVFNRMELSQCSNSTLERSDNGCKRAVLSKFWKNLKENCNAIEKTSNFKNIAFMNYSPSISPVRKNHELINDEISWLQYAAYRIYCQHQKYLRQLEVQKVILSSSPLDLSKCDLYNKLCDALITGQPLTPLFVLYAMIEQLAAGVPETESIEAAFDPVIFDFFPKSSEPVIEESVSLKSSAETLVTPCAQCRDTMKPCEVRFGGGLFIEKSERSDRSADASAKESGSLALTSSETDNSLASCYSGESSNFMALVDRVLTERKPEKDARKGRKCKTPRVCFYGDSVTLQTHHCDPRLIDPEEMIHRFMRNVDLIRVWSMYPELGPAERAYYNFHYNNFLKISGEKEETLRMKLYFAFLMKVTGESKFYLFVGNDENVSADVSIAWKNFQQQSQATLLGKNNEQTSFSNFFFDSFITDLYSARPRRSAFQIQNLKTQQLNDLRGSEMDSNMYAASGGNGGVVNSPQNFMNLESLPQSDSLDKSKNFLLPVLDCLEISSLSDFEYVNQFEEFTKMVKSYTYYEKLWPDLMIQKLLECREEYNAIVCSYFPPTDSLAILLHNDSDYRGVFSRAYTGSLPTPVCLRDFYNHVYPEISEWVVEDVKESEKALAREEKAKQDKKDEEFLTKLKFYYCQLNDEDRRNFLEQEIDLASEPEVKENELRDLPYKIEAPYSSTKRFVVTNLGDLRVETGHKLHQFHSRDGSEVHISFEGWMYDPCEFVMLTVRRFSLWFRYNSCSGDEEKDVTFTLKTASGIIFVFFKEPGTSTEESRPFRAKVSWPTGLMAEVKSVSDLPNSSRYVKQWYIKTYRKGWEIEEEKSRCYLKNGEILIIKESGNIKILTGSGTVHSIFVGEVPLYETITTTGEVWELLVTKGHCRKRRKISTSKVYLGFDRKTGEIYYKRDDGTSCMLWPDGKLVTNYPDGTKITSTPDFEEGEVTVEWSEEEKRHFSELKTTIAGTRSRSSIKSSRQSRWRDSESGFVSVSCAYLMEHPKYSTVYCEINSSLLEVRMPENLKMKTPMKGCYEVQKENNYLIVKENVAQFDTRCEKCGKSSTAFMDFDSNVICHAVDLFGNEFLAHKNGETIFHENVAPSEHIVEGCDLEKKTAGSFCSEHTEKIGLKQRCFFLERNLSGVEFIHEDKVAHYFYELQDDSHFDLNTDDPNCLSHTISESLSKIAHETWVMSYEKDDSLPTNLKKKDLKDIEVKENRNRLFKYPFPQRHDVEKFESNNRLRGKINLPKIKLVRVVKCLPFPGPMQVITEVRQYAERYRSRGHDICNKYCRRAMNDYDSAEYVKMRLKKIAITLNQTLTLYPHVCTQLPSTEKDVHYFGHLIKTMEEMKNHFREDCLLPKCKQIPRRLPRLTNFPTINEE